MFSFTTDIGSFLDVAYSGMFVSDYFGFVVYKNSLYLRFQKAESQALFRKLDADNIEGLPPAAFWVSTQEISDFLSTFNRDDLLLVQIVPQSDDFSLLLTVNDWTGMLAGFPFHARPMIPTDDALPILTVPARDLRSAVDLHFQTSSFFFQHMYSRYLSIRNCPEAHHVRLISAGARINVCTYHSFPCLDVPIPTLFVPISSLEALSGLFLPDEDVTIAFQRVDVFSRVIFFGRETIAVYYRDFVSAPDVVQVLGRFIDCGGTLDVGEFYECVSSLVKSTDWPNSYKGSGIRPIVLDKEKDQLRLTPFFLYPRGFFNKDRFSGRCFNASVVLERSNFWLVKPFVFDAVEVLLLFEHLSGDFHAAVIDRANIWSLDALKLTSSIKGVNVDIIITGV